MFGLSQLSKLFPIPPASLVGEGFQVEGELTGVHALTADPPSIGVFVRGRDSKTYLARFVQTAPGSIMLTFSAEPDLETYVDETHPPR